MSKTGSYGDLSHFETCGIISGNFKKNQKLGHFLGHFYYICISLIIKAMTIEYYLKPATKSQLSEGKCPIFARIRVRTKENTFDIRLSTGLFTSHYKDASEWRETMSNTKKRNRYASTEEGHTIIPILDEISEKIDSAVKSEPDITSDIIRECIESVVFKEAREKEAEMRAEQERQSRMNLNKYFAQHIERKRGILKQRTIINLEQAFLQLRRYQKETGKVLDFEDMTNDFHDNYIKFLSDMGQNTVATHIKNLKAVLNSARKDGFNNTTYYMDWRPGFVDIDAIYLTDKELDAIADVDLSKLSPGHSIARDIFFVGIYTSQRVSDYNSEKINNIQEVRDSNGNPILDKNGMPMKFITLRQKKTGKEVIIPVSSRLDAILSKYGYSMPHLSEQKINMYIKEIARMAGIDEEIKVVKHTGKGDVEETYRKWELIGTHTARRTGATLMYLAARNGGMREDDIREITGHSNTRMLEKYIRANTMEKAAKLGSNPFFD